MLNFSRFHYLMKLNTGEPSSKIITNFELDRKKVLRKKGEKKFNKIF